MTRATPLLPAVALSALLLLLPFRTDRLLGLVAIWLPMTALFPAATSKLNARGVVASSFALATVLFARAAFINELGSPVAAFALATAGILFVIATTLATWPAAALKRAWKDSPEAVLIFLCAFGSIALKPFSVQFNLPLALSKFSGNAACGALDSLGIRAACRDVGCGIALRTDASATNSSDGIAGVLFLALSCLLVARRAALSPSRAAAYLSLATIAAFATNVLRLVLVVTSPIALFRYHVGWMLYLGAFSSLTAVQLKLLR